MRDRYMFRGKTEEGVWVYGGLMEFGTKERKEAFIMEMRHLDGKFSYEVCPVVPESVGLCTGFRDNEENPIFENDIVKGIEWDLNLFDVIVWDNKGWKMRRGKSMPVPLPTNTKNLLVVSNLYDAQKEGCT